MSMVLSLMLSVVLSSVVLGLVLSSDVLSLVLSSMVLSLVLRMMVAKVLRGFEPANFILHQAVHGNVVHVLLTLLSRLEGSNEQLFRLHGLPSMFLLRTVRRDLRRKRDLDGLVELLF